MNSVYRRRCISKVNFMSKIVSGNMKGPGYSELLVVVHIILRLWLLGKLSMVQGFFMVETSV